MRPLINYLEVHCISAAAPKEHAKFSAAVKADINIDPYGLVLRVWFVLCFFLPLLRVI